MYKRIASILLTVLMMLPLVGRTQKSSIPFLRNSVICDSSKALLAISADFNMYSIHTRDVRFYFEEITTGKIISPDFKDQMSYHLYFNVPTGIYRISKILIKQPAIDLVISFNNSSKIIEKSIQLANSSNLFGSGPRTGIGISGVLITGDKNLAYSDTISNQIEVKSNTAYFLGDFHFEGYSQGLFNDMPNIRINRIDQVSAWKISSFIQTYSDSYPNSTKEIVLNESPFKTDYFVLAKKNALKRKLK